MAQAFFTAAREGDLAGLRAMLADAVVVHADGGGKRPAALAPIAGIEAVLAGMEAYLRRMREAGAPLLLRYVLVNGLPGFVTREADGLLQTTALEIRDGRIAAIYVVRNPDKLAQLDARLGQRGG